MHKINEAAIKVVAKGYSPAMRYLMRTQRVNLGWIHEVFKSEFAELEYCPTNEMRADPLTKAISPGKWGEAMAQLGMLDASLLPESWCPS